MKRNGPSRGRLRRTAAKQFDWSQTSPSLASRAAMALHMRRAGADHRTIWAICGRDADGLAAQVEGYEHALGHLADVALPGIEPMLAKAIRDASRGWSV